MLQLLPLILFSTVALAQEGGEIQDNLYKEEAAVVLPVFYVVKFEVEGYSLHLDTTTTTTKLPVPTVVHQPQNLVNGNYANMISPTVMLEKLAKTIDEQLDSKTP